MMFLQPLALFAIPLVFIPLLIHWLNHRRHKPVHWAATHFLKQAQKHNRGMAKLRYWLLLMLRMAAIAAIVFLLARPLHTGYLSAWTGTPATQIVILDLSPSMQSIQRSSGKRMIEQAVEQLDQMRLTTGQTSKRVVFTQDTDQPLELPAETMIAQALPTLEQAASSDIPATVLAALQWSRVHTAGPIDLWICSDLRESDWQSNSRRWQEVSEQLEAIPGHRLNILSSSTVQTPNETFNAAISVSRVVHKYRGNAAELIFDLRIRQTAGEPSTRVIPLSIEIGGVRTTLDIELSGAEAVQTGLRVPVDVQTDSGFGLASIPADSNPADNQYRFVFAKQLPTQAVVVADEEAIGSVLQLALERPESDESNVQVRGYSPAQATQIDWQNTAIVAWQAELPTGEILDRLLQIVDRGGTVFFLPGLSDSNAITANSSPASKANRSDAMRFDNVQWSPWQKSSDDTAMQLQDWRSDSDLLRNSAAGQPISVDQWRVTQYRRLMGPDWIPLAKLTESEPLLARFPTVRGGLYFLATLPEPAFSNLVEDGVSLYVMMQRALEIGLSSTGNARCLIAGVDRQEDWSNWHRLDNSPQTILDSQRDLCSAVYQRDSKLIALNRPVSEDDPAIVDRQTLDLLWGKASYQLVETTANSVRPLASEIWRWFAAGLVICLLVEAWMTMPRGAKSAAVVSGSSIPINRNSANLPWRAELDQVDAASAPSARNMVQSNPNATSAKAGTLQGSRT